MDTQNNKVTLNDNLETDIADQTNKDDIDNETLDKLEENPNVNILGVATIEETKPQDSSHHSSTMSSENVLTEFDETVYPLQMALNLYPVGVHCTVMMMGSRGTPHKTLQCQKTNLI